MTVSCPICTAAMAKHAEVTVLGRYHAVLSLCPDCGFLTIPEPYWFEEAYSSPIASTDTGIILRNLHTAEQLAVFLYLRGKRGQGRYLDVAGGYGILVRLMRDLGFDFWWSDIYAENLLARGFEWTNTESLSCEAVTAMEVIEHVSDPVAFLSNAMQLGQTDTVIFSTTTYEIKPPDLATWSYYSFGTGQHIAFFQRSTLERVAERLGAYYRGVGNMHVISRHAVPPFMTYLAFSRARRWLLPLIRKRMKGLVTSDHAEMVARVRERNGVGAETIR